MNKKLSCLKCFTLVELLVAMAVFAVLMLALMQFFTTAQRLWTTTAAKTEIYENARIAMDLITTDIQSIYYEQDHDNKKMFLALSGDLPSALSIANKKGFGLITSRQTVPSGFTSRLCEIIYFYDSTNHVLKMTVTGDNSAAWDFNKFASPVTASSNPFTTYNAATDATIEIIPYVTDFNVYVYKKDYTTEITPSIPGQATPKDWLPYLIVIEINILDKDNFTKWEAGSASVKTAIEETYMRKFTRSILIERGQYY